MTTILETERLILREFSLDDASFILHLLNTPTWLQFIGDRGVRNLDDARHYLLKGPINSYLVNGFGLYMVTLKKTETPIGMCGLVKRNGLDDPDIGFALLPEFAGKNFAYEVASAMVSYAQNHLLLPRLAAITTEDNTHSIKLLNKLGLQFEQKIQLPNIEKELLLFGVGFDAKARGELR